MELSRGNVEVVKPKSKVMNLALPAILEMFMNTLVQYVDTFMVSQLGPIAIAAISLSSSPMWLIMGVFTGISVGTTALVARYVGAGDIAKANLAAKQSVILGLILSTVVTVLILLFGQYVPKLMGAEPEVVPFTTGYLKILSVTFVLHFTSFIASAVLRGAGDTKTPMRVNVLANILNIIGNFFLIFPTRDLTLGGSLNIPLLGELILPQFQVTIWGANLGVYGAAISTALTRGLAGILMLLIIFNGKCIIKLRFKERWRIDKTTQKSILTIGFPAALERVVMSSGQIFFTRIVAGLGTKVLAGHYLAIIAESLSYMPGMALQMAATTLVGQSLGANKPEEAKMYGMEALKVGAIIMSGMGLIFFFLSEQLIGIFNNDPEVIIHGALALRIVAFSQPFFASAMVLSGALRGAGDTVWPLRIALIGMWAIRLSLAVIFVKFLGLGLMGAWLAMGADLAIRGTMCFIRFNSGKWMTIKLS